MTEDELFNNTYVVSMVYQKQCGGELESRLKHSIVSANSTEEATGKLMNILKDEMENYSLAIHCCTVLGDFMKPIEDKETYE